MNTELSDEYSLSASDAETISTHWGVGDVIKAIGINSDVLLDAFNSIDLAAKMRNTN